MDNMYYGDYYNSGFSYGNLPINNIPSYECEYCHRSGSLNSDMMVTSSNYSSSDRVDNFFNANEGFVKGNMQSNIYQPYKLTNSTLIKADNERERLLLEVQKYSFAMWDLNLYLNTHPTDRNIMMLFDQYRTSYKKAKSDYESKYGSFTLENVNANGGTWNWNKSPWPWEVD